MKTFLLVLVVLSLTVIPVYAGNIPLYGYEYNQWEEEQKYRNLYRRQQILEEQYRQQHPRRTLGTTLNDSLKMDNLSGHGSKNIFQQR